MVIKSINNSNVFKKEENTMALARGNIIFVALQLGRYIASGYMCTLTCNRKEILNRLQHVLADIFR